MDILSKSLFKDFISLFKKERKIIKVLPFIKNHPHPHTYKHKFIIPIKSGLSTEEIKKEIKKRLGS